MLHRCGTWRDPLSTSSAITNTASKSLNCVWSTWNTLRRVIIFSATRRRSMGVAASSMDGVAEGYATKYNV